MMPGYLKIFMLVAFAVPIIAMPTFEGLHENLNVTAPRENLNVTAHGVIINATLIFTKKAAKECGEIRTPELVLTPNSVLLFGQCRQTPVKEEHPSDQFGDDFRQCSMVMLRSTDGGLSWGPLQFISKKDTGVGVAVYDRFTNTVVLQYQVMPYKNPYQENRLLQVTSTDEGRTWSEPRDLTSMLAPCNTDGKNDMMCGAAGSRLQLRNGRLVFSGHNTHKICVWYSDDHGKTYQTSNLIKGNENSIAELADGRLYMNGRGTQFTWAGNRSSYWSVDGGKTWSDGAKCPLAEPNKFGCSAAMISVIEKKPATAVGGDYKGLQETLFFSEPLDGPGRKSYRIACSRDQGRTWPSSIIVNHGEVAGYSALLEVHGDLLAVWEQKPNMLSHVFKTHWCKA